MALKKLITQARVAASTWGECDEALAHVNESFGAPFEAARDNLNLMLLKADEDELDLTQLQGAESEFRFRDLGALVMVRVSRLPVPFKQLETIDIRIEKLERELKLAKSSRKQLLERAKIKGHQFVTEKITTAYKRITK